jgi:capsular exopolysaccharide synthesis family protein
VDFRQHIRLLLRWSWAIVLCALLAGGATLAALRQLPPQYAASTTLMVYQAPASSGTSDYTEILTSSRMVRSYAEALRARPLLEAVIENLALDLTPAALAEQLTIRVVRETQLIVITVESQTPAQAATIANELVDLFIAQHIELTASLYTESKEQLEAELTRIQDDIDQAQQRLSSLGDVRTFQEQAEYDRIQMLLWQHQSRYSLVFHSLENVRMAEAQSSDLLHVIEPAQTPDKPTATRSSVLAALAALGSGFLVILAITVRDYLDTRIRSAEHLATLTQRPVLATLPYIRKRAAANSSAPLAEAAHTLAARLSVLREQQAFRTLLVSSSLPREGKSTVASHLAHVLARSGERVILLDANLHHPTLHLLFDVRNISGLSMLLDTDISALDHALLPTGRKNLLLLPAGSAYTHMPPLLYAPRLAAVLAALAERADTVIIDSAALSSAADSILLAQHADATLLVVQANATSSHTLQQTCAQLAQTQTNLIGTVLTTLPRSRRPFALRWRPARQRSKAPERSFTPDRGAAS